MFLSEKLNVYIPFSWTSLVKCCFLNVGMKGDAIWKMKQKEKNLGDGVFSLLSITSPWLNFKIVMFNSKVSFLISKSVV